MDTYLKIGEQLFKVQNVRLNMEDAIGNLTFAQEPNETQFTLRTVMSLEKARALMEFIDTADYPVALTIYNQNGKTVFGPVQAKVEWEEASVLRDPKYSCDVKKLARLTIRFAIV